MVSTPIPYLSYSGLQIYSEEYLKGYAEGYEACKVDMKKFVKSLGNGLTTGATTTFMPNSFDDNGNPIQITLH